MPRFKDSVLELMGIVVFMSAAAIASWVNPSASDPSIITNGVE